MTEERRLEILKLVAIFRLANALDKSKRRKLRISKIRITNEKLEIKAVASGSALLEKWAFAPVSLRKYSVSAPSCKSKASC